MKGNGSPSILYLHGVAFYNLENACDPFSVSRVDEQSKGVLSGRFAAIPEPFELAALHGRSVWEGESNGGGLEVPKPDRGNEEG